MNRHRSVFLLSLAVMIAAIATSLGDAPKIDERRGMSLRLELFVSDLDTSCDFYTKVLGFERLEGEADYAPVRSGSVLIGLCPAATLKNKHYFNPDLQTSRRGLGTEIVLEVDDVRTLFETVKATGYKKILSPVRQQPWGLADFRIADPDGYYLRFTSR